MFEHNTTSALASEFRIRVARRARSCVVNNRLRPFGYAQGTQRTPLIANTYPYQPCEGEGIAIGNQGCLCAVTPILTFPHQGGRDFLEGSRLKHIPLSALRGGRDSNRKSGLSLCRHPHPKPSPIKGEGIFWKVHASNMYLCQPCEGEGTLRLRSGQAFGLRTRFRTAGNHKGCPYGCRTGRKPTSLAVTTWRWS